jgi:hypothetical protein
MGNCSRQRVNTDHFKQFFLLNLIRDLNVSKWKLHGKLNGKIARQIAWQVACKIACKIARKIAWQIAWQIAHCKLHGTANSILGI